jgi:MFS family permease
MSSSRTDRYASAMAIVQFSFALGVANVALPLLALAAGYTAAQIGVLTAVSAVAQLAVRTTVPALTRRFSDRTLVTTATVLLAVSCALVSLSTAAVPFTLSEVLQGVARGYFWSGSQLHAVRTRSSPLRAIAFVNLISSVGLVAGPVVAGLLAAQSQVALTLAAGAAVLGSAAAMLMTRLAALEAHERGESSVVWRRPPVLRSSTASAGAGAWSALLVSYVPVVLAGQQPGSIVGILVALANASNIVGSVVVAAVRSGHLGRWLVAGAVANGVGLALVTPSASSVFFAGLVLVLSGLGSGVLLTLGPALATAAVGEHERASAIALTGGARAAAMLVTPLVVAAAVTTVPLGAAIGAVGVVLTIPAVIRRRGS